MDEHPVGLSVELESVEGLRELKDELVVSFEEGEWPRLAEVLRDVARIGEVQGRRELSLRAQSLQELMGDRGRGEPIPRARAGELFEDLIFHLSHLEWVHQGQVGSA